MSRFKLTFGFEFPFDLTGLTGAFLCSRCLFLGPSAFLPNSTSRKGQKTPLLGVNKDGHPLGKDFMTIGHATFGECFLVWGGLKVLASWSRFQAKFCPEALLGFLVPMIPSWLGNQGSPSKTKMKMAGSYSQLPSVAHSSFCGGRVPLPFTLNITQPIKNGCPVFPMATGHSTGNWGSTCTTRPVTPRLGGETIELKG